MWNMFGAWFKQDTLGEVDKTIYLPCRTMYLIRQMIYTINKPGAFGPF